MIKHVLTSAAFLAALSFSAGAQASVQASSAPKVEIKVKPSLASTVKVSGDSAFAIARSVSEKGEVSSGELELEDGRLVYEIKLLNAKKKISTVQVDAMTGEVINAKKNGGLKSRLGHHKENKKLLDAKRDSAAGRP